MSKKISHRHQTLNEKDYTHKIKHKENSLQKPIRKLNKIKRNENNFKNGSMRYMTVPFDNENPTERR